MFCSRCGKEIQEEWAVCPNCGAVINGDAAEKPLRAQAQGKVVYETAGVVRSREDIKAELIGKAFSEKGGVVLWYGAGGISKDLAKVLNPGEEMVGFYHAHRTSILGQIKSLRMFRDYIACTNQRFIYIERGQAVFSLFPFFKKTVSIFYSEILNVASDKRIGIHSGKLTVEGTKKKVKLAVLNRNSAEELREFLISKKYDLNL